MDEVFLLSKYNPYISKCAWEYLTRSGQPAHMYEDLKSEAALAFIGALRKYQMTDPVKNTREFSILKRSIRGAMRSYVWRANGQKDKNKPLTPIETCPIEEIDLHLQDLDDFSGVEVRDTLDRLSPSERFVLKHMMEGYSQDEIAEMRGVSPSSVSQTISRLRNKLKDIA